MSDRAWQLLITVVVIVGCLIALNVLIDGGAFR